MDNDSHAAIANLIEGLDPGSLVTQFVVVAEVIGGDGDRSVWIDTHDGASRWDIYGLLEYALNQERLEHHNDETRDDD